MIENFAPNRLKIINIFKRPSGTDYNWRYLSLPRINSGATIASSLRDGFYGACFCFNRRKKINAINLLFQVNKINQR